MLVPVRLRMIFMVTALLSVVMLVGCGNDDDRPIETTSATEATVPSSTDSTDSSLDDSLVDDSLVDDSTVVDDSLQSLADDSLPPDTTAVTEDSADVDATDATDAIDATGGVDDRVPVASLAASSPTCEAISDVHDLNEDAGALSTAFTQRVSAIAGSGADADPAAIEEEFEKFLTEFNTKTDTLLPGLQDAYARLAAAQPQFSEDLALIERVSLGVLEAFRTMKGSDLDRFDELLIGAVPAADLVGAGTASLKIDAFARKACGVSFANT